MSDVWAVILASCIFICAVLALWASVTKRASVSLSFITAMMAAQSAMQWFIGNHWVAYFSAVVAIAGGAALLYRRFAQ